MDNLTSISDMYSGQIDYYFNKYYFIKDKLVDYTFKFNEFINKNYEFIPNKIDNNQSVPLNSNNSTDKSNEDNSPKINNDNKKLININNNREILKINNKVRNHNKYKENVKKIEKEKIIDKKEFLNKFYKKLAKKCHPDKTNNKKLNFIFIESQKAMKDKNISFLIFLINKAKIEIDITDVITFIQEELTFLEQNIKNLTGQIEWQWCNINNDRIKSLLVNNYVQKNNLRKKSV